MLRSVNKASLAAAAVTVGGTSTQLVVSDANRRWVDISNDSISGSASNSVWLRIGQAAFVGVGVELRSNKTWRLVTTEAVYAVASASTPVSVVAL